MHCWAEGERERKEGREGGKVGGREDIYDDHDESSLGEGRVGQREGEGERE